MSPQRPGIKDVAQRADVGISTVSRVFSGSAAVNPERKARVLAAASELGYRPDILAQSLRRGATMSVGFIADDLGDHLNIVIATGAEGVLRARRHSLLVMNSEMDASHDAENVRVLMARRVDALVMAPVTEDDPELVGVLSDVGVPVVIVEGDLPGAPDASFVVSDHRAGAIDALTDLAAIGHRRIAVVTGPDAFRSARERRAAIEHVAAARGPDIALSHWPTDLTHDGGGRATAEALGSSEPPTALLLGGDHLLNGALEAIASAGLQLGRDISLVTTDPVPLARIFTPPLATITRDAFGVGQAAARILLQRIDGDDAAPDRVVLPTTYERRPSVGPPPSG